MKKVFYLFIAFLLSCTAGAQVQLPALLGDGMVLQRNTEARLWGKAAPAQEITVTTSWDHKTYRVQTGRDGKWETKVTTGEAGGPHSITIDDGTPRVLKNILIGEVWICSGQSNMEMPLMGNPSQPNARALETLMEAGSYPEIRLFQVKRESSTEPREECSGEWKASSMANAAGFSAVAYHFGLSLYKSMGIPVGLIESDWGGSRIESWMSRESALGINPDALEADPHHAPEHRVAALLNGMLMPLTPFSARGFIWYQGESNIWTIDTYARQMETMVAEWRKLWGDEKMPFYFVQLVPYDYDAPGWRASREGNDTRLPRLQEQQIRAAETIPYSGIAVTTDLEDDFYIHPPVKDAIGQRLALLALSRTYGLAGPLDDCGPMYDSVEFSGEKAIVSFKSQSTLCPLREPLHGFEIAGEDQVFYPGEAYIEHQWDRGSHRVVVTSPWVKKPVAVRYAFRNLPGRVNLTNTLGIPAYPFRTDRWNDVY